jgi:hypothetical protein
MAGSILPTTLLILYFISPAQKGPKDEANRIWTLQSTVSMQFTSHDACKIIGNQLINDIKPVATMTVRAYCLCPDSQTRVAPGEIAGSKCEWGEATITEQGPGVPSVPSVERLGTTIRR